MPDSLLVPLFMAVLLAAGVLHVLGRSASRDRTRDLVALWRLSALNALVLVHRVGEHLASQ